MILAEQADLTGLPAAPARPGGTPEPPKSTGAWSTHGERSQADLRADLDRLRLPYQPYYLVNAVEVHGGPAVRAWLSGRDDVDRVLRSQRLRPLPAPLGVDSGTPGLSPRDPEWNIAAIKADQVWSRFGVTGEGIVIGSSDSGVDAAHPALASGFRGDDDSWFDPWNGTVDARSTGPGTAPTRMGRPSAAAGIGVAPGSRVDRLRQPRPQRRQPGLLPGLPAVHAGAVPARR